MFSPFKCHFVGLDTLVTKEIAFPHNVLSSIHHFSPLIGLFVITAIVSIHLVAGHPPSFLSLANIQLVPSDKPHYGPLKSLLP